MITHPGSCQKNQLKRLKTEEVILLILISVPQEIKPTNFLLNVEPLAPLVLYYFVLGICCIGTNINNQNGKTKARTPKKSAAFIFVYSFKILKKIHCNVRNTGLIIISSNKIILIKPALLLI